MKERPEKVTVTVAMPVELHSRLKICAEYDTRTLSAEIRQILKGYLEYLDRGGVSWCDKADHRGVEQYHH